MSNKRVTELSPITPADIADNDLFLISDVSALESKKATVLTLTEYFQSAITSSATSSNAVLAKTASYLLYQGIPNGTASYARTSSFSVFADATSYAETAIQAVDATSASYAKTSSLAVTASYALTSSVQLIVSSAFSDQAKSASYLIYTGIPNGTASYSILANLSNTSKTSSFLQYTGVPNGTSSNALNASFARSSSYLLYSGYPNGSASYALISNISRTASTSSFLQYNSFTSNGTASNAYTASYAITSSHAIRAITSSHALLAGAVENVYKMYGPFAMTVSGNGYNTASVSFSITSSTGGRRTYFEFDGEASIPLTSSAGGYFAASFYNAADVQAFGNQSTFNIYTQNTATGSINMPFMYRMLGNNSMLTDGTKWAVTVKIYGSSSFTSVTGPPGNINIWVYSTSDSINLA